MAFLDARRLDRAAQIEGDVCIVGAGAAGISLALEFINTRHRVVLLESGGLRFRHRPQFLYIGSNVGLDNFPLARSRYRQFGGSTTRWTGQCAPLESIDFQSREWVNYSGWPFDRTQLEPWYRRAERVCQLQPYQYRDEPWNTPAGRTLFAAQNGIVTRQFQFAGALDFGRVYGEALDRAENVTVCLNANALEIEVNNEGRQVTGLRVATLDGRQLQVRAPVYVLAAGGIENARLLLASNRVEKNGVGNRHDLVGRFFMDHPYFFSGYYEPADPALARSLHVVEDYSRTGTEQRTLALFALDEDVMRRESLVNCGIFFVRRPDYKTQPGYFAPANRSFTHVIDVLRHADLPDRRFVQHLRRIFAGRAQVAAVVRARVRELLHPRARLALRAQLEPSPNPDSRVTLTATRDRLGLPRVSLDWRLNADDKRSLVCAHEKLAQAIERRGLGRLFLDLSEDSNGWPNSMSGGKHHMGTTRMHADPRQGVVDADCRVHGVTNLYIAGSSVFPTGGYANPTLTIVALALRLADHLKEKGDGGIKI